jgi:PleD family two-component response regulator
VSCGVAASGPDTRFDFTTLWAAVDEALYAAKHGGRDRVHVAEEMRARPVALTA